MQHVMRLIVGGEAGLVQRWAVGAQRWVLHGWVLHGWVLHGWVLHGWVLHGWVLHGWVLHGWVLGVGLPGSSAMRSAGY